MQYCFFLIFLNKIYNTYRDLHTRLILNNVLKVTLDIVENVFFSERAAARINYEFIYDLRVVGSETIHVLPENRAWRLLSRPPGINAPAKQPFLVRISCYFS